MSVDFPRAWQISKETPIHQHDPQCSFVTEGGAFICDCQVLMQHPEVLDDVMQGYRPKPSAKASSRRSQQRFEPMRIKGAR